MTELIWDGKYKDGKKQGPVRIALPFQTIETVNESAQDRRRNLELFGSGRDTEWRNRLIWGDKKYVLPSLLPEFAGKVNLIYIDPPFDTGTDFSYTASIPNHNGQSDDEIAYFTKEASIIEQKAYRDTWGSGLNSYIHWFYEAALLLRELLAENGTIFVHIGQNISHHVKLILDEVFGPDRYLNQIVWKRQTAHSDVTQGAQHLGRLHDVIFLYTKSEEYKWQMQYTPYDEEYTSAFYKYVEPQSGRRYRLSDITAPGKSLKGNPYYEFLGVKRYWRFSEKKMKELYDKGRIVQTKRGAVPAQKRYLDEMLGVPLQDVWLDVKPIQSQAAERVGYDTQKPEALLERIIKLGSGDSGLVLDCFVGSGTTAVVAEKLNRRWIACDLSRFSIHTTRKRLLGIPNVKPFVVQNLGKYERQAWQAAEFPANGKDHLEEQREREAAYRRFLLDLYHARPMTGYAWLHGTKAGRMVHVAAVDAPVTQADVKAIAREAWKALGMGKKEEAARKGSDRQTEEAALKTAALRLDPRAEQEVGPADANLKTADREEAALKTAALRLNPKSAEREEDASARLNPEEAQEAALKTAALRSNLEAGEGEEAGLKPGATLTSLKAGVDILGWEFALEVNELAKQIAAESRVDVAFKKIPREVLDKKAVEQGDVRFFELGALSVDTKKKGREVTLKLSDFVIPTDDIPEEARKAIKHWSQLVDYWAVDWDYKNDTFHNEWQAYRTRKEPKIELATKYEYKEVGKYQIVVKVIDILGNDTTKTIQVEV